MNQSIGAIALLCLILLGCGQNPSASDAKNQTTLTISAAASLKDSMETIKEVYQQQKPQVTITYNFGGSGSLQQQIERGAPVDIFMSAAEKQMDVLQKKGLLIDETRKNLLTNKVVLIVPKNNSTISDFKSLNDASVNKIALAEPESVPAGKYAREVLISMGLFESLKSKVVFTKDVRQVLSYVETGNVEAGIVYETDAKVSNKVRIVTLVDAKFHSPIVYPVAVVKNSKNVLLAKKFIIFLESSQAKSIFEKYGFKRAAK